MPGPPPPPPPPAPPAPPSDLARAMRRLRRSRSDRMLGGVAGGIAQTYGWDPTVVRLAWVVAAIFGIGIPAYLVAWLVIPPDGPGSEFDHNRDHGAMLALVLLGVGVIWLASLLFPHRPHFFNIGWPLILVAGGIAVLLFRVREHDEWSDDVELAGDDAPAVEPLTPDVEPDEVDTTEDASDPVEATAETTAETTTSAWGQTEDWPGGPPGRRRHGHWDHEWHEEWHRRRRNRPRPFLGPLVFSLLLVGAGVLALVDVLDIAEINVAAAGAVGLGLIGAALIVSAFYGRAHGLIALGILLSMPLGVLTAIDVPLEGGAGDRTYHPTTVADVRDEYRLAFGQMTIDLRDVNFREGTHEIEASVAFGELLVQLPDDVTVAVTAENTAGVIKLFGQEEEGWDTDASRVVREAGSARLILDLEVGFGQIDVTRFADDTVETQIDDDVRETGSR